MTWRSILLVVLAYATAIGGLLWLNQRMAAREQAQAAAYTRFMETCIKTQPFFRCEILYRSIP